MGNKPIWEALAQRNYSSYGKIHIYSSTNLMTLISLYLHNSQLLEHKENISIQKKCIFYLERRKYIPWG
jgi:hypothetical protein